MTATVVASNPSLLRKSRITTLALIFFPVVIGAGMLWLRHVEVERLASRQIQGYGSVPPFQLINQDGQPFGSSWGQNLDRGFHILHLSWSMPDDQQSDERNAEAARENRRAFRFLLRGP
jgi:hypothetical protein